jgi:serine-type D-Ala-D-Ala carboxypeptidase/endopeptidase (penicillin-binding protein 4)
MRLTLLLSLRLGSRWVVLLACVCGVWPALWATTLTTIPEPVSTILAQKRLDVNAISAIVAPVEGGDALLSVHAQRPMNPGSVIKLVTTAAAVDLLGPEYAWQTRFYADGPIQSGVLLGNLYVKGGGDPKLVLERIQAAFAALQAQGVNTIMGDWVLDRSAFDIPVAEAGGFDGEALRPYNVQPEALLVNFKSVILKFNPDRGAGVARVQVEPPMAELSVPSTVKLRRGGCGDWRSALRASVENPLRYDFAGAYPSACGNLEWPVAYIEPQAYAGRALLGLWRSVGGRLEGKVREGTVPQGARLIHSAPSLPLSDIIADVNKFSNNVMAQQVFLTLGTSGVVGDEVATFERSRSRVSQWWRAQVSAQLAAPEVDNGSGLSRQTRVSAEQLLSLLRHAAAQPNAQTFIDSLSIAGIDGTVSRLGRDGRAPLSFANARLKTGTLKDVTAIAGYVTNTRGQRLVVIGLINDDNAKQARSALYALVEWAAAQ